MKAFIGLFIGLAFSAHAAAGVCQNDNKSLSLERRISRCLNQPCPKINERDKETVVTLLGKAFAQPENPTNTIGDWTESNGAGGRGGGGVSWTTLQLKKRTKIFKKVVCNVKFDHFMDVQEGVDKLEFSAP